MFCILSFARNCWRNEKWVLFIKYRWVKWFRFRENESTLSAIVRCKYKKSWDTLSEPVLHPVQSSGTAKTIFSKTVSVKDYLEVPWENCVGFSLDNVSANMGIRNSIRSRIIAKSETCYIMGCPCQIIHNTAH